MGWLCLIVRVAGYSDYFCDLSPALQDEIIARTGYQGFLPMVSMINLHLRLWVARLLVAIVVAWNLECALVFLLNPGLYAPAFELTGIPGLAAIRGFGVLFVMWNIPYLVALWNPHKKRVSLWEALAMQSIGVLGESLILLSIPAGHTLLHTSVVRFIAFDAAGVLALIAAVLLERANNR